MESSLIGHLDSLLFFLLVLLLCALGGIGAERWHFAELDRREKEAAGVGQVNLDVPPEAVDPACPGVMVVGEVVIASDYRKTFLSGLKRIVGGELRQYTPMMERARREALLRLKEQALAGGYDLIANVRLETVHITFGRRSIRMPVASVIAYGTACKRREPEALAAVSTVPAPPPPEASVAS